MPETTFRYNPETGKPNPVSQREFHLMDRKESRAFLQSLSKVERKNFSIAYATETSALPLKIRREQEQALVAKLEQRENRSIGDKLEVFLAKLRLKQLMLPERPPIFLHKLRSKEFNWPKWAKQMKSPYLISSR